MTPQAYTETLKALSLTQARLARLLRVDKQTTNRWAQGAAIPHGTKLLLWCVENGRVTVDELEGVE